MELPTQQVSPSGGRKLLEPVPVVSHRRLLLRKMLKQFYSRTQELTARSKASSSFLDLNRPG